jgi:hypothetical protein
MFATLCSLIALAGSPPQLIARTVVPLRDGGTAALRDAPFLELAPWFRSLDAGTLLLESVVVDVRDDTDQAALHVSRGKIGVPSVEGGDWVELGDVDGVARVLRSWPGQPKLALRPDSRSRGEDLLSALHIAADAGCQITVELGSRPPTGAEVSAIERTFDSHIAEGRQCFGETTQGELRFVIGPTGHIQQVRIIKGHFDERCLLPIAERWEFAPPTGGGVIVGRRTFSFPAPDAGQQRK